MAVNRKRTTHRGGRATSVGSQNATRRRGVAADRRIYRASARSNRNRVKPINSGSAKRQRAITRAVSRNK